MATRQPTRDERRRISKKRDAVVSAIKAYRKANNTQEIPSRPCPDTISRAYESYVVICNGIRQAEGEPGTTVEVTTETLQAIINSA